uniref:AcidPPc domain-containing protein n=1 Tax=Syphacia muris TaxID=451379 RepID=A0A0N5AG71_9BILA
MLAQISVGRVVVDIVVLTLLAFPLLVFQLWVKPYKRGFYCDDESLRYPYRDSTVSRYMLVVVGLLVPASLIVFAEMFRAFLWEKQCQNYFHSYRVRRYPVHRFLVRLYIFLGYFLLGVIFNQLLVDIAKYTIGRHRPHFIDICRPMKDGVDFATSCPADHRYITDFNCTGNRKGLITESMLSFYSGHTAFSFFGAWFTALYLQARLYRPLYSRLILPIIQFCLFGGAAYVGFTRVSDYKHHWSDVLVGALLGSAIGIIMALFVAEVFKRREIPKCEEGLCKPTMGCMVPAPKSGGDVESGMHQSDAVMRPLTTHTVTVTHELSPSSNECEGLSHSGQQRL